MTAEPATSNDGALRGALHTTLPAEIPSRSTLLLSAKLNVPDAGLIRAHVSSLNATMDELVNVACFPESATVSPVTSDMATGPVDCCAWFEMLWPLTVSVPVMLQLPLTLKAPVTDAPVSVNDSA